MLKKTLLILACVGSGMAATAQADLTALQAKYEAHKRDLGIAKEYAEALEKAGEAKEAEAVVREYMGRCPVVQVEDKDTYLFVNRYVFEDPYSNVFDHGIYAIKKMKWDREEKKVANDRVARLMDIFKGMSDAVSGDDEIDKRYEVLATLSNNLSREIDRQCVPAYEEGRYVQPAYDAVKIAHLTRLVEKGGLLNEGGMRVKLAVAKAMEANDQDRVFRYLENACELGLEDIRGSYAVRILSLLVERGMDRTLAEEALAWVTKLSEEEKPEEGGTNYYYLLADLHELLGNREEAEQCKQRGDAIEAERMAQFGDLFKALQGN